MATTKAPKCDWLKAKVRTARMTMEIDGPLRHAICDVFIMLGDKDREAVIAEMKERHESMLARAQEQPAA
ncbi:hypothetical protein [Burkholderia gladioli]|uniref:hypothetical protein n=1 Tax=Burkholderia gladioli TaxID=28095 RepID=UPI0034DB4F5F